MQIGKLIILLVVVFLVSCSPSKLYEGKTYTFRYPSKSYTRISLHKGYVLEERILNLPCFKDSIKIVTKAVCSIDVKSNVLCIDSVLHIDTLNTSNLDALRDTSVCVAKVIKSVVDIYNHGFSVEKKPDFCMNTMDTLSYGRDKSMVFNELIVCPSYVSNKDTFFITKKYPKYILHKSKGPWFCSCAELDTTECLNFLRESNLTH